MLVRLESLRHRGVGAISLVIIDVITAAQFPPRRGLSAVERHRFFQFLDREQIQCGILTNTQAVGKKLQGLLILWSRPLISRSARHVYGRQQTRSCTRRQPVMQRNEVLQRYCDLLPPAPEIAWYESAVSEL